ncbi:hypothetical protein RN001_006697, partial [Aquatica leii]
VISKFTFKCDLCKVAYKVTSDEYDGKLNKNGAAVLGAISIGCGFSQLNEFVSTVNITEVLYKRYKAIEENLQEVIEEESWECMFEAGKEEAELARQNNEFDENNIPMDNRPFKVQVNKIPLLALLDSGANQSVIGKEGLFLLNKLNLSLNHFNTRMTLQTADDTCQSVLGLMDLPVTIDDSESSLQKIVDTYAAAQRQRKEIAELLKLNVSEDYRNRELDLKERELQVRIIEAQNKSKELVLRKRELNIKERELSFKEIEYLEKNKI